MKHILTILSILLFACAAAPASQDRQPIHYDTGSSSDEDDHTYSIETDSEETISLKIRISNAAGDTLCDNGHIYTQDTISATDPAKRNFSFSRKGSPNIALYEWHLCFIKDGVVYRGWRGFDPGPNTVLKVKCFISTEQLSVKNTDRYMCKTNIVTHLEENYSEPAQYCWNEDTCRRFESGNEYSMFLARGAKNVALFKTSEPKEIVTLTVPYEYIGDKAAEELKMAWIGEQEEYCSKEPARFKSWCEAELLELKSSLNNHNEWRYRLTEKALTDSFQKLSAQKVIFKDTSHLDYTTTYKFTPHEYNANQVFFYSIECPAKLRKQKEAICTLILNQAFYSENPSEYFYIEKTSDVETAIWAYAAHKDIPVIPANDWMERWLEHPHRVSTVEIDDDIAKFSYHSGGCWHQVWYRIVGNNEKLEFIKTTGGFCV